MSENERFGPSFLKADSFLYRLEYGVITLAILAYLLWRTFYGGGIEWIQTFLWILFPDLVAFIPIGLSRRAPWPSWGAYLYDLVHTVLAWGLTFAVSWWMFNAPVWPLLGWLGHITADRALGFGLREAPASPK